MVRNTNGILTERVYGAHTVNVRFRYGTQVTATVKQRYGQFTDLAYGARTVMLWNVYGLCQYGMFLHVYGDVTGRRVRRRLGPNTHQIRSVAYGIHLRELRNMYGKQSYGYSM